MRTLKNFYNVTGKGKGKGEVDLNDFAVYTNRFNTSMGFDGELLTDKMDEGFLQADGPAPPEYPLALYNAAIKNSTSVADLKRLRAENEYYISEYNRQVKYHLYDLPKSQGRPQMPSDRENAAGAQSWANTATAIGKEFTDRITNMELNPGNYMSLNRKGDLTSVDEATIAKLKPTNSPLKNIITPITQSPYKKYFLYGGIGLAVLTGAYFLLRKK